MAAQFDRTQTRSEILNEAFKGLLLVNGGGAVATATLVQAEWGKGWPPDALRFAIYAIIPPLVGIGFALVAMVLRYFNSLRGAPSKRPPNPWWAAILTLQFASIASFVVGMLLAVCAALAALQPFACRDCLVQLWVEVAIATVAILAIVTTCWVALSRSRRKQKLKAGRWLP